jgi:hypothetical protein
MGKNTFVTPSATILNTIVSTILALFHNTLNFSDCYVTELMTLQGQVNHVTENARNFPTITTDGCIT